MARPRLEIRNKTAFNEWLDAKMAEHNLNLSELARRMNCSPAVLTYLRLGQRPPTAQMIPRLVTALGVSIEEAIQMVASVRDDLNIESLPTFLFDSKFNHFRMMLLQALGWNSLAGQFVEKLPKECSSLDIDAAVNVVREMSFYTLQETEDEQVPSAEAIVQGAIMQIWLTCREMHARAVNPDNFSISRAPPFRFIRQKTTKDPV